VQITTATGTDAEWLVRDNGLGETDSGSRSDIESALDENISNEEGMKFQGLAVVLAKKRWPELIACERKKDFGADAIAKAAFCAEGGGEVLACSITATLRKVRAMQRRSKTTSRE
jgi:hypothetical protein